MKFKIKYLQQFFPNICKMNYYSFNDVMGSQNMSQSYIKSSKDKY